MSTDTTAPQPALAGVSTVRFAGRTWQLAPGGELSFGRGPDQDIRFAYEPEDDWVSRRAGTLIGLTDGVLIRNDSRTQGLVLQAFPGPEMPIGPQVTLGTRPFEQLRLVVPGRHGGRYALIVDTRRLRGEDPPADAVVVPPGAPPTKAAARVTPRELRLLTALCEPVLTLAGEAAVPATYREVAARTGQTAASVRTCLDTLRQRLTDQEGIPGLRGEPEQPERGDYRAPLVRWALQSGTVTRAHLDLLR
jgi:hypothetical protein